MAVKDRVYLDIPNKTLMVDGVPYVVSFERKSKLKGHDGNPVFTPMKKNREARIEKAAEYLAKRSPGLTVKDFIVEALKGVSPRYLANLERNIRLKKRVRQEHGCISLRVGDQVLGLAD